MTQQQSRWFLVALLGVFAACSTANAPPDSDAGSVGGGAGGSGGGGVTPVTCTSNAQCTAGVCDTLAKVCVSCLFSSDCATGQRCTDRKCEAVTPCTNSLDCVSVAGKPVCDPKAKLCEQCAKAADCTGTADCVDQRCVPYISCVNSLACAPGVCDMTTSRCVACVTTADCASGQSCINRRCAVQTPCQSDVQCTPQGKLCDTPAGFCVRCLAHVDCPAAYHCAKNECVLDTCVPGQATCQGNAVSCNAVGSGPQPCAAMQSCTVEGAAAQCKSWVCSPGLSECQANTAIECSANGLAELSRLNCSTNDGGTVCVSGQCKDRLCDPSQLFCDGNAVKLCSATGQTATVSQQCSSSQYCDVNSPACRAHVCQPSQPTCNSNIATSCNGRGSGYLDGGTDCSTVDGGQVCVTGQCSAQLCVPNQMFCDGNAVKTCNATGSSAAISTQCTSTEYCDTSTVTCRTKVCTPGQPACNGSIATTCNAAGSGYVAGGTDCALSTQACVAGACQLCGNPAAIAASVRLIEVFVGGSDYVLLQNRHPTCPAQLMGMQLRAVNGSDPAYNFTLPARTLAAGAQVYVAEAAIADGGEIQTTDNIPWAINAGGYAMLCTNACATSPVANVVDAISFRESTMPVAFPSPVTFSPGPLTSITTATEDTKAFKRVGFTGSYPSYTANDWGTAAPSRTAPTNVGCPATQPASGTVCLTSAACTYGAVTCFCMGQWLCF